MEMKTEFRREMNRNYMVLSPPGEGSAKYTANMLANNCIAGLLPFHEKEIDGEKLYYYDITSRQPISRILELRDLTGEELHKLLSGLLYTLTQMERYLLDEGQICLDADRIYAAPDTFDCLLCLIPGASYDFSAAFGRLSEYLLNHVNHTDSAAVVLAFGIFREGKKENFSIRSIEKYLEQTNGRRESQTLEISEAADGKRNAAEKADAAWGAGAAWESDTAWKDGISRASDAARKGGLSRERDTAQKGDAAKAGSEDRKSGKTLKIILALVMAAIPALVFCMMGLAGIKRYQWILVVIEAILIGASFLADEILGKKKEKPLPEEKQTREIWPVQINEEPWKEPMFAAWSEGADVETNGFSETDEDSDMQTVLLTAGQAEAETRTLIPLAGGETIYIRYFPFIIGKNKAMADYCLEQTSVSRIHVRIDKKDMVYTVTDLNSTNGTAVQGRTLESNETAQITPGEELSIAEIKYRFT